MTDDSQICLIDLSGNLTNSATVSGGIIREAKMAIKWSECNQTYYVFYPSGINDLTQISIDNLGIISSTSNHITKHPDLIGLQWSSTGIWSKFITDIGSNDLFENKRIALFVMNDTLSNDLIKISVRLDISLFCNSLSVNKIYNIDFILDPSPTTSTSHIDSENIVRKVTIYKIVKQ